MEWIIGALPSVLVVAGGLIGAYIQSRIEKLRKFHEAIRKEKWEIYRDLLDPIITVFAGVSSGEGSEKALKKMISIEYRKLVFSFMYFGSDEAIKSFNEFFQFAYKSETLTQSEIVAGFRNHLEGLMFAIRADTLGKETQLEKEDMLRAMIVDENKK